MSDQSHIHELPPPPEGMPADDEGDWLDVWVLPYIYEPTLWPVFVALAGHVVVLIVPVTLALIRTGDTTAGIALLIVIGLSGLAVRREWVRRKRLGALTVGTVLIWLASAGGIVLGLQPGVI